MVIKFLVEKDNDVNVKEDCGNIYEFFIQPIFKVKAVSDIRTGNSKVQVI